MKNKPFQIRKRLKSFVPAFRGLKDLIIEEHNSRIHLIALIVVVIAGIAFHINAFEWIALFLAIGLVFVTELLNSAIERAVDLGTMDQNPIARQAKDMAAGAVLFAAIISVIIAVIIFGQKIFPPKNDCINGLQMETVQISTRDFIMRKNQMGDRDEKPMHKVRIKQHLFVSATEVTNVPFEACMPKHKALSLPPKSGYRIQSRCGKNTHNLP